jgi:AraC-like DNA-binding protein
VTFRIWYPIVVDPDNNAETQSYIEQPPVGELRRAVRSVWIQRTGAMAYLQRHMPTGGVEIHVPSRGSARLLGPLTGPKLELIPPHTTLIGIRFQPGTPPALPTSLEDLVDAQLHLGDLWGSAADRLTATLAEADEPETALRLVQDQLVNTFRNEGFPDPLVRQAVLRLMPWHPLDIAALAEHLSISPSQLRRRCLDLVGISPKALQRTLRFQGFLALAQAGAVPSSRSGAQGLAGLAVDVGYSDHAHLSRECARLTGLSPSELLGGNFDRCACEHDHAASFKPFLATRAVAPLAP